MKQVEDHSTEVSMPPISYILSNSPNETSGAKRLALENSILNIAHRGFMDITDSEMHEIETSEFDSSISPQKG